MPLAVRAGDGVAESHDEPLEEIGAELVARRVDARPEHGAERARRDLAERVDRALDHAGLESRPSRVDRRDRAVADDRHRGAIGGVDHQRQPDGGGDGRVGVGHRAERRVDAHHVVAVHLVDADPFVGSRHSGPGRGELTVPGHRVGVVAHVVGEVRRPVGPLRHPAVPVGEHHARACRRWRSIMRRSCTMRRSLRAGIPGPRPFAPGEQLARCARSSPRCAKVAAVTGNW